jgi:pyrroloquinoline quinone (PQQ) biosynthesis protein C
VCITKSPSFGTTFKVELALEDLLEHILQEIKEDHHELCLAFIKELGICRNNIAETQSTTNYINSFIKDFLPEYISFFSAMSALAGRELTAPQRNRIIIENIGKYNVVKTLKFFKVHEELEKEHFCKLWQALVENCDQRDIAPLVSSAKKAISDHIDFWDSTLICYSK